MAPMRLIISPIKRRWSL